MSGSSSGRPEFRFGAAGDFGTTPSTNGVLKALAATPTDFFLALGDFSYQPTVPEQAWCDLVTSQLGSTYPFEVLSGNHEDDGPDGTVAGFAGCLPNRLDGVSGSYGKEYFFDYPPQAPLARFVMVSPGLTFPGEPIYAYTAGTAHYDWLSAAIDDARAREIPWVIVGMHEHCLGLGHPCQSGTDLVNLLTAKKVDLILQAHDHSYQRGKQLALGPACPAVPEQGFNAGCVVDDGSTNRYRKGEGPVTVIDGTGGAGLGPVYPTDPQAGWFARLMGSNATPSYGFTQYTVTQDNLSATFVPGVGSGGYQDSFSITAAEAPPFPEPPPASPGDIGLEAESGLVGAALTVVPDGGASESQAIHFAGVAPTVPADGIRVAGTRLVRDGAPFLPVGFTMIGALSPNDTGPAVAAAAHLDDAAMEAARSWGANTVRFQVSQRGLDFTDSLYSDAYLARVDTAVALARAHGLAVILSVQDQQGSGGGTRHPQPSDATIRDWQALTARFNDDPYVMYEMFNEPQNKADPSGWAVWRDGGPPEGNQGTPAVGHQTVLNAIRATGARNVVLADAAQYGQRLDGVPFLFDPLGQLAYAVHPYLAGILRDPANWQPVFGAMAGRFPVVATEWNVHSRASFCQPEWGQNAPQLVDFLRERDIGLLGWAFDILNSLILDWDHTPTSLDGFQCGLPDRGAGTLLKTEMPLFQPHVPACAAARSDEGAVVLQVDVPADGLYRLWSRVNIGRVGHEWASLLQVDDGCPLPEWAGPAPTGTWTWVSGPDAVLSLSAGRHTLRFLGGAEGFDLDRIVLTENIG